LFFAEDKVMRNVLSGGLVAAALGTALMVAAALPASAQIARPQTALATGDDGGLLTLVKNEKSGGGGRVERSGGRSDGGVRLRDSGPTMSTRAQGDVRISGGSRIDRHAGNWNNDWRWRHRHRHRHSSFTVGLGFGAPYFYDTPYYAYDPGYYVDDGAYVDDDAVAYCMSRFRSYNPATGTYTGFDGLQHPCP
jgi:hypothetical protein